MTTYVLVFKGGAGAALTEEQEQANMLLWRGWFAALGDDLVDGGNPFVSSRALASDGGVQDASSDLTGYSIIKAEHLDAATEKARGCPVLANGGSIEIYETFDVM
jgi:hypothetical protein